MTEKPGLTYILGLPFSGTSLFSLALGTAEGMVNCGEAMFLENDWNPAKSCSCGAQLSDCAFWSEAAAAMAERRENGDSGLALQAKGRLHPIDARRRSFKDSLRLLFGSRPEKVFGENSVRAYAADHAALIDHFLEQYQAWQVVDASKSARRLGVMVDYLDVPVRVIVVRRNSAQTLGARIKRARRRRDWYFQALAPFYIAWLLYHQHNIKRVLALLPSDKVLQIRLEDFLADPGAIARRLSDWYGRPVAFAIGSDRILDFSRSHVYTGNIWMFRFDGSERKVPLRPPLQEPELAWFERGVFQLAQRLFPQLRD